MDHDNQATEEITHAKLFEVILDIKKTSMKIQIVSPRLTPS